MFPFSIRFMLGAAAGAAVGFGVSRVMEARALGVPLSSALRTNHLLIPVSKLAETSMTPAQADAIRNFKGNLLPSVRPA